MRSVLLACTLLMFAPGRAGAQEWLPLGNGTEWRYDTTNEAQIAWGQKYETRSMTGTVAIQMSALENP